MLLSPPRMIIASTKIENANWNWSALTDRKSTRLNSSHANISYAVFCLKKKKKKHTTISTIKQIYKHQTLPHVYSTTISHIDYLDHHLSSLKSIQYSSIDIVYQH